MKDLGQQEDKAREKGPGECPKCGSLSAFAKEIDTTNRRAVLVCQNEKCGHEWNVDWPIGRKPGRAREWRGMDREK
jgi:transcription elongation factor Elf1